MPHHTGAGGGRWGGGHIVKHWGKSGGRRNWGKCGQESLLQFLQAEQVR